MSDADGRGADSSCSGANTTMQGGEVDAVFAGKVVSFVKAATDAHCRAADEHPTAVPDAAAGPRSFGSSGAWLASHGGRGAAALP